MSYRGLSPEQVCNILNQWAVVRIAPATRVAEASGFCKERCGGTFSSRGLNFREGQGVYFPGEIRTVPVLDTGMWDYAYNTADGSVVYLIKDPVVAVEFKLRFG